MPPAPAPRRARVSAVLLLVVLAAAFAWGLAMFALGRGSVETDTTPVAERDLALAALGRIDQALDAGKLDDAKQLIAGAHLPEGLWQSALAQRQHRLDGLINDRTWHFRQLSPHPLRPDDWLAIANDRRGLALVRSRDAGAHWDEIRRLESDAIIQRSGDTVLVRGGQSWWSVDGGGAWQDVPALSTGRPDVLVPVRDGALFAATGGTDGANGTLWRCGADHIWQAVASAVQVQAIADLEHGVLVLATQAVEGRRELRISSDGGLHFLPAGTDAQAAAGRAVQMVTTTDQVRVRFVDGPTLRFARSDGAFLGTGN
jgi:hypothetical protein